MKQFIKNSMEVSHSTSWRLSGITWVEAEQSGVFPSCEYFLRLPKGMSMSDFIHVRIQTPVGKMISTSTVKINTSEVGIRSSHLLPTTAFSNSGGTLHIDEALFIKEEIINKSDPVVNIAKKVIKSYLLRETIIQNPTGIFTLLTHEEINSLIHRVQNILVSEETIVKVSPPLKIFGDIRGNISELLRIFFKFGSPNHYSGDIDLVNYVFNGNFIDKGTNSLEVICLLFSIKFLYPKKIYLIRGLHEFKSINGHFGFKEECSHRLGQSARDIYDRFNDAFTYLPLCANVSHKILIVPSGIGSSFKYLSDVARLSRPIGDNYLKDKLLLDIILAIPAETDHMADVNKQVQGRTCPSFNMKDVLEFCENNEFDIIVRSNQLVPGGYEFFSGGRLITVFSATNSASGGNRGAILTVSNDFQVRAKVIRG